jgi:hypothetical protein
VGRWKCSIWLLELQVLDRSLQSQFWDGVYRSLAGVNTELENEMLTRPLFQVEPQEKKKTPKGRAKKRITYTRRFVNVTLTGGKRKVSGLFYKIQK